MFDRDAGLLQGALAASGLRRSIVVTTPHFLAALAAHAQTSWRVEQFGGELAGRNVFGIVAAHGNLYAAADTGGIYFHNPLWGSPAPGPFTWINLGLKGKHCREIAVHPTGKYLFVSNRGHNSVALFTIDPAKGELSWVEEQGTGGKTPRHFGIQPNGAHMAICNQESDTVLASRIDASNGRLKPSGIFAEVPSPACAVFLPPAEKA